MTPTLHLVVPKSTARIFESGNVTRVRSCRKSVFRMTPENVSKYEVKPVPRLENTATNEGYVTVLGCRLIYRTFGASKKGIVLCLHGGPGATHDYILPLADLSLQGYRVVFYDQLGCGRSELPKDRGLFVIERYTEEVEEFRRAMRLGKVHLIGSSFRGQLAISYALRYQKKLKSLITVGGYHSMMMVAALMQRMKDHSLPTLSAP
jgi:proline iminopeptidase